MKKIIGAALVLLSVLAISSCSSGDKASTSIQGDTTINVVATTGQVADMASRVGGDLVSVRALMGPGIDPHLYKASARDVERLRNADIIFYNGLHLEAKMGDVIEQLGRQKPVRAIAESVPKDQLISPENYEGSHDPHIWFDVALWKQTVPVVVEALSQIQPENAAIFEKNGAIYMAELDELHLYATEQLGRIPEQQRVMITAHDAFNYFGRAYGLEVRGLQGISTATEAGTRDVQELAVHIADLKIPAIFIESSVSPRAVNAVKEAVKAKGFEVVIGGEIFSDALGDADTPAGNFIGMVRHNVDVITAALRGEGPSGHE